MTNHMPPIHSADVSSINHFPTMTYAQPDEYHFSHDSVFLAKTVCDKVSDLKISYNKILDLCSGCGIVGLDLAWHLLTNQNPHPQEIDFLEIQNIYKSFFLNNLKTFSSAHSNSILSRFLELNYDDLLNQTEFKNKYDLIISNPPYFRKGLGVLSKSEFKNRCRFFLDSDFNNLILAIEFSLASHGSAFVLLKSLKKHGIDIQKEFTRINTSLTIKSIETIRGTDLYHFQKIN